MTGPPPSDQLVSCIVPVFNGQRFLAETLESIFAQTHGPVQVIVVDDGSTDGTPQVIAGYADRVIAVQQANAGPVVARNRGLAEATGDYIGFLDADDCWTPDKIEKQLAAFAADPGLSLCITHAQNFWEDELADEAKAFADHPRAKPMPGYVTQTLLAPRSTFDTVGGFDESLEHGDAADWFLRAEQAGLTKALLPDVLVRRRVHRESLSRRAAPDSREEFLKLIKASLDRKRKTG